jgi:hypothetical protein
LGGPADSNEYVSVEREAIIPEKRGYCVHGWMGRYSTSLIGKGPSLQWRLCAINVRDHQRVLIAVDDHSELNPSLPLSQSHQIRSLSWSVLV